MTPETRQKLKGLLISHESFRQFAYIDTTNHLTIGIGRNLSDRGISQAEAILLLDDDILYFTAKLDNVLPFFNDLDDNRKIVLINMCFNLGVNGFLKFQKMLDYCEQKDFLNASKEILNSEAAHQNPNRYQQLAYIMKTGEF